MVNLMIFNSWMHTQRLIHSFADAAVSITSHRSRKPNSRHSFDVHDSNASFAASCCTIRERFQYTSANWGRGR